VSGEREAQPAGRQGATRGDTLLLITISKMSDSIIRTPEEEWSHGANSSSHPPYLTAPLVSTLKDVTDHVVVYGEVSRVVQSLVEDIEMAQSVNDILRHRRVVENLERKLRVAQAELEERRAYDKSLVQRLHSAGDAFVGELLALTVTWNSLQHEVEQNRTKLDQFDAMQQKLQRSEELVRTLQRTMSFNRDAYCSEGTTSINVAAEMLAVVPQKNLTTDSEPGLPASTTVITATSTSPAIAQEHPQHSTTIQQPSQEPQVNVLEFLDETLILHIFSYLDAIDVVHTAMVNVSFYARVDSLFGLSTGSGATPAATTATSSSTPEVTTTTTDPTVFPSTEISTITTTKSNKFEDSSSITTTLQSSTEYLDPSKSTVPPRVGPLANVLSRLGQPKTPQTASTRKKPVLAASEKDVSASTNALTTGSVGATIGTIASSSADPVAAATTTAKSSSTTSTWGSMANSMADKLTQAELAVIIRMVEQIRSKDREIAKIAAEREDLAARLESTEAVKEFLISRVKDAERSLKIKEEEAAKTLQQFTSDQEVIGYLDYRVKELERMWKESEEKFTAINTEYLDFKSKAQKRQIVLEDMLQFERQQLADSECEWKATKKLLVKEVKHCRAQLLALQAERDSFRHKNAQLKQALLTINSGTTIAPNK